MLRKFFSRKGAPGAPEGAQGAAQGPAQGTSKWETDPSACLADAQERLSKLRGDISSPDAFPSINEATRRVNQLDYHVRNLPDSDPLKPIWTQQLHELQTELQTLTEAIMSSMESAQQNVKAKGAPQSVPRAVPDPPEPVKALELGGDLFSGLMVSAGGSALSQQEVQVGAPTDKDQSIRPALDEDLFSNLDSVASQEGGDTHDGGIGALSSTTGHSETQDAKPLPQAPTVPPVTTRMEKSQKTTENDRQTQPASRISSLGSGTGKKKKKASRTMVGYDRGQPAARPSSSPVASTGHQVPAASRLKEEPGSVSAPESGGLDLNAIDFPGIGDLAPAGSEGGPTPVSAASSVMHAVGDSTTKDTRGDRLALPKTDCDKVEVQHTPMDQGSSHCSDANLLDANDSPNFLGMTIEQPSGVTVTQTPSKKGAPVDLAAEPGVDFAGLSLSSPPQADGCTGVRDVADVGSQSQCREAHSEHKADEDVHERSGLVPSFLTSLRGLQSTTERFLQDVAERNDRMAHEEQEHLDKRTKLLIDLTETKELIRTLEQQQTQAVENEDFDAAAMLATKIDDSSSLLGQCLGDLQQVGTELQSCMDKRVKLIEAQVSHRKSCVDGFRALQTASEEEAACAFAKKKEEFEGMNAIRAQRDEEISAAESAIPAKRLALEKDREALIEDNRTEKEEKQAEKTALEEKQAALEEEIDALRSRLAAKVAELEEVSSKATEICERLECMQGQLDSSLQALADNEAAITREEKELAESRLGIEDECTHIHDFETQAQEQQAEALQQAKCAGDEAATHEAKLCILQSVVRKQIALKILLTRVHREAGDARRRLKEMRERQTSKRNELRALASDKAKVAQKKIVAEDQAAQADLRLPQIEADKKAAAANKDFQEAARLSGEAKKLVSEKETAQGLSTDLSRQLVDLEEKERTVSKEVSDLEGKVKSAAWETAKCQWCCFRVDAGGTSDAERDGAGNGEYHPKAQHAEDGKRALEKAAQQLAAEFDLNDAHIEAVLQELKGIKQIE